MNDFPIWRYLSLAKYVDMLRSESLYFPKASRFLDETEGKWWAHAVLYESAQHWAQSPANIETIQALLDRAGDEPSSIIREISRRQASATPWVQNILNNMSRIPSQKWTEYLASIISSWKKHYDGHNPSVLQWRSDIEIIRESTYISCWNRGSSMSLAMWEMYGGGSESVAIRSTHKKLGALLEGNRSFLKQHTLKGGVALVEYLEGLPNPNEAVQERIHQIIFETERDTRLGIFSIKPSLYYFEQEVRAILYPTNEDIFAPLVDLHPNVVGFAMSFNYEAGRSGVADFIESVHVHPLLDKQSLMFQAVSEINRRFNVGSIPVVADKIEALGSDVTLP